VNPTRDRSRVLLRGRQQAAGQSDKKSVGEWTRQEKSTLWKETQVNRSVCVCACVRMCVCVRERERERESRREQSPDRFLGAQKLPPRAQVCDTTAAETKSNQFETLTQKRSKSVR
jgi:hypothetical protein